MLEQDSGILLVNTNRILDGLSMPGTVDEISIKVLDTALAVAAEGERVGHVASSILAKIKSMLALMWMLWIAVRNHHLGEGEAIEDGPLPGLIPVVKCNVVQDETFLVVETNVELPILPAELSACKLERDSFRLRDLNGHDVRTESASGRRGFCPVAFPIRMAIDTIRSIRAICIAVGVSINMAVRSPVCFEVSGVGSLLNSFRVVVESRRFVQWSPDFGNVNIDDFLCVGVEDGTEVKRVGVLTVVHVWPIVHERLLQTNAAAIAFIIPNGPCWRLVSKLESGDLDSDLRSQYTLSISSAEMPRMRHCSITFGSVRQTPSTILRSSMVIWSTEMLVW